jgi:hypothetical protein
MRRTAIWHFTSTAWKVTNLVAFLCSHILTCEDAQSWTFRELGRVRPPPIHFVWNSGGIFLISLLSKTSLIYGTFHSKDSFLSV